MTSGVSDNQDLDEVQAFYRFLSEVEALGDAPGELPASLLGEDWDTMNDWAGTLALAASSLLDLQSEIDEINREQNGEYPPEFLG